MKMHKTKDSVVNFVEGNIIHPLKFKKEITCKIQEDFCFGTDKKSYNMIKKGSVIKFEKRTMGGWDLNVKNKPKQSFIIRDESDFSDFCHLAKADF